MLTEMTLKLPEALMRLPAAEREGLIRAGLHEATRAQIKQLKIAIAEAQGQVRRFETRYGASLARFESDILVNLDSLQVHDDYNDWFYWQNVLAEKQAQLADLQGLRRA